jgi:hypothetical protein
MRIFYPYDLECYPNFFSCTIRSDISDEKWVYEISPRKNQGVELFRMLCLIKETSGRMVGFNNIFYDYKLLHEIIKKRGVISYKTIYEKNKQLFNCDDPFEHNIWESDVFVNQVDLFKIHHFDNKGVGLKELQFNMRMDNIQELPYKPGTFLVPHQMDEILTYNDNDVIATKMFLQHSKKSIKFRDDLSARDGKDYTNYNDGKIGKSQFIASVMKEGVECYDYSSGRKRPIQTLRPSISLIDIIFPCIKFEDPEFNRILNYFKSKTITETKGVFKGLNCQFKGVTFSFGLGGIHASIDSEILYSDDHDVIIDMDVKSYYPSLSAVNDIYPAHIGPTFCLVNKRLFNDRLKFPKSTHPVENFACKLGMNASYGDTNAQHSCLYDPAHTMTTTVNGQLFLCMLAECCAKIHGLRIIQANTDGITVKLPRCNLPELWKAKQEWEQMTKLELESNEYSRMFIRDVNSYIAEYESGELKRIGAYKYGDDLDWSKDFGGQVIAKAAEHALVKGGDIRKFIYAHRDKYDFMMRAKVDKKCRLEIRFPNGKVNELQRITRYYVSKNGGQLVKIMPPLPKKLKIDPKSPEREERIEAGQMVETCNNIREYGSGAINYEYYIREAKKLVDPLRQPK